MPGHEVVDERIDGCDGVALVSDELRAGFAPTAGMVGYSLTHRGEQLLGLRGGLAAYRERGSSFGIPLLHPWANRLSEPAYAAPRARLDANGLPIHGLLAASPLWRLTHRDAGPEHALVGAQLDFGAQPELLAAFPFPHELRLEVQLAGATLAVVTELAPTADTPVPVSFGWHPYLRLPEVARGDWHVELPVRTRALLDERGIPTGALEPAAIAPGPLGAQAYDDLFSELEAPAVFALEGAGRRVEVELGEGYPVAQVYAPPGDDFICFEPMTAPTNALVSGAGLRTVAPGERFRAEFRIRISA
jgi:aldose 1-epimerase